MNQQSFFKEKLSTIQKQIGFNIENIIKPEHFSQFFNQKGIDLYNQILGGEEAKEGSLKKQGLNEIINLTFQQIPQDKKPRRKEIPSFDEFL